MTPLALFLYGLALAGGVLCVGVVLLALWFVKTALRGMAK